MRVVVHLRRQEGAYRPPYGQHPKPTGDLHLTHLTVDGRRVAALQLLGADRPISRLFDPKLVELASDKLRFIGFERVDRSWVMQEWDCQLLPPSFAR
jgi:hypothetical protein